MPVCRSWMQAIACLSVAALALSPAPAAAQNRAQQINAAIERGTRYLRGRIVNEKNIGEIALASMALLKSGIPSSDPDMQQVVGRIRASSGGGGFRPGGKDNYEAAVVLMALSAADPDRYRPEIEALARYIMAKQRNGQVWGYDGQGEQGDTSMSQYAILALWEASELGIEVPIEVWDRALAWYLRHQDLSGGFSYHPYVPVGEKKRQQGGVTHSMSVAGCGTMIICRTKLPLKQNRRIQLEMEEREYLIPADEFDALRGIAKPKYAMLVKKEEVDEAISAAENWIAANFTVEGAALSTRYYYLYGIERYASFSNRARIGNADWYNTVATYLLARQQANGSWESGGGEYNDIVNTSFALLFLERATQKTINRLRVDFLPQGTLFGGRGMPTTDDPENMDIGRRRGRFREQLKAPVEDLLAILDDPEAIEVESAASAIEQVDPDKLIKAIGNDKRKLRALAVDPRPGVRRAALWALAKTRDFRVAPVLIAALRDKDAEVYAAARDGLRYLSRRTDPFGLPPSPPPAEALGPAISAWQAWFESLQVDLEPEDAFNADQLPAAPPSVAAPPGGTQPNPQPANAPAAAGKTK